MTSCRARPKNVPQLPDDEAATQGLTMCQLVERHTSDPRCASCHCASTRLVMRSRLTTPSAAAAIATWATGHRHCRATSRRHGVRWLWRPAAITRRRPGATPLIRQFCRKFLGFALGRDIQLSDHPLLRGDGATLKKNDYRFSAVLETVVTSRQFREIRGKDVGGLMNRVTDVEQDSIRV